MFVRMDLALSVNAHSRMELSISIQTSSAL
jgi:hypothetical protein